jgi:hypothetical protein
MCRYHPIFAQKEHPVAIKKQLILIPYWVEESVRRSKLGLADTLVFEKIKAVMALNDLIQFAALQEYFDYIVGNAGKGSGKETNPSELSLVSIWFKNMSSNSGEAIAFLSNQVCPFTSDASFKKELEARLFGPDALCARYTKPFDIYDITPEVAGVVIYPGFFNSVPNQSLSLELVESLLKVLYVYNTYSEVSKTPLFKRHLQLLSGKKIIV